MLNVLDYRWIDSLLSELVTEEQWKFYLTLLTNTIWPEGELMNSSAQEKSEEERLKTKEEAIATLSNFFGGKSSFFASLMVATCSDIVPLV